MKYAFPDAKPAAKAASAPCTVPPFAVMNAEFQLVARVVSKVFVNVPDVTPMGNPANVGTCVATPTVPGGATQQWMCAAAVVLVKPENITEIFKV